MRPARLACALLLAACDRAPTSAQRASDVVAAQDDRVTPRDLPPPPPAALTLTAAVAGASSDPPLRALDPTMAVPRWQAQGTATLTVPPADGAVEGALTAGDLSLRVRGFRRGDTVLAQLDPAGVDADAGEDPSVWRGLLDARIEGGALRGTWTVSAQGGRFARTGTLGAR